jgi:hypothetical protein
MTEDQVHYVAESVKDIVAANRTRTHGRLTESV